MNGIRGGTLLLKRDELPKVQDWSKTQVINNRILEHRYVLWNKISPGRIGGHAGSKSDILKTRGVRKWNVRYKAIVFLIKQKRNMEPLKKISEHLPCKIDMIHNFRRQM